MQTNSPCSCLHFGQRRVLFGTDRFYQMDLEKYSVSGQSSEPIRLLVVSFVNQQFQECALFILLALDRINDPRLGVQSCVSGSLTSYVNREGIRMHWLSVQGLGIHLLPVDGPQGWEWARLLYFTWNMGALLFWWLCLFFISWVTLTVNFRRDRTLSSVQKKFYQFELKLCCLHNALILQV